ncbi:MAG: hypothetical protein GY851_36400 [bacterium]|nr:hypothetical protein [bacterium]
MSMDHATGPRRMDVFASFSIALEQTKRILFRPFDINRWFSFGIIIFIAGLAQGGGGGCNFNYNMGGGNAGGPGSFDMSEELLQFESWVMENLSLVLAVGLLLGALMIAVWLLLIWLNSRGKMMLIRAVAQSREGIGENWRETQRIAWSLFLFQAFLSLVTTTAMLIVLAGAYSAFREVALAGPTSIMAMFGGLVPFIIMMVVVVVPMWLIRVLLTCFVTPLMYHFDIRCLEAWGAFRHVSQGNVVPILGFLMLRLVYSIGKGIAATLAGCITCCIGGLPVIHQTLFAPYYVFDRAFSMYVLQSAGPDYEMILEPEPEYTPPPPIPEDEMPHEPMHDVSEADDVPETHDYPDEGPEE